ncbi:MAG TPA: proton-conducting transporter membrane subunit, partial [Spirochaetota bacterium]
MNNEVDLFLISLSIQILAVMIVPFISEPRKASAIVHLLLLVSLAAGFANTLGALIHPQPPTEHILYKLPSDLFLFDPLGLYFLAIIQLIAIPTTIYSYSYFNHYSGTDKPVKSTAIFFVTLLVSTQLVAISNHAILFLISWELMSISAYLGMIFEKEKKEVQTGSFYYLIISHVAMYLLFIFFILLHHRTGSWLFSNFHLSPEAGHVFILLYLIGLIAFGIKAGLMPFHFWLPRAHPIAPSALSAFLSGVIIKMGIFGILRTLQFLSPAPEWIGWMILVVSMVSAVFGVWYALAQHDIKQLLAYHSVENIGIIGMGIGIGIIGAAHHSIPVQFLGFGGALLHTLNHAIFKNLLFIGSGIISQNLGTRNIELMGGLVHRGKYFALLFLIGSVAICGIPPFNGFISEFIIFNGFFATAHELKHYYPLLMLLLTVGLALVGGLAVACFSKINSIMFLGTPRKEISHFDVSVYDYLSLGILASLCIVIGFFPQPFIHVLNGILADGFIQGASSSSKININWFNISFTFALLILCVVLVYLLKFFSQRIYGKRKSPAWG